VVPLTGNNSYLGQCLANGAVSAVDEWNARGGVAGKKISIVQLDDQGDRFTAVTVARRLVSQKIDAVIGHLTSECTMAASPVYSEEGIVMITPSATNPMITDRRFPNIFRLCGRDDRQGQALAEFANSNFTAKRIVIIHDRSTYGQGLASEFEKNLQNRPDVVLYSGMDDTDEDIVRLTEKIRDVSADLVMFSGIYVQAGKLVKSLRAYGVECPFVTGDGAFSERMIEGVTEANENIFVSCSYQPRLKIGNFDSADPFFQAGYSAANLLLSAIEKAGTAAPGIVADTLYNSAFPSLAGNPIRFDSKGDCSSALYSVYRIRNGQFEPVEPQTDKPVNGDVLYTEKRQIPEPAQTATTRANIKG